MRQSKGSVRSHGTLRLFNERLRISRGSILFTWILFLFVGALSGLIIAWALDMNSPKELLQGAAGGLIAGLLMSAMLPH